MRKNTPNPPTNPPEPDHYNEEHLWEEMPSTSIVDGSGRKEQNNTEFEIFNVIHEEFDCMREGCDATLTRRLLFDASDVLSNEELNESNIEKIAQNCERVDYNALEVQNPVTGGVVRVEAKKTIEDVDSMGACTGKPPRR